MLEKGYQIEVCRNCPNAVIDVPAMVAAIENALAGLEIGPRLKEKTGGRLLHHQLFRVAVAGCPNSCSQPQIKDFGVQGRAKPMITAAPCIQCRRCEAACLEEAVQVGDDGPTIAATRCVECGQCARACPTGTIVTGVKGGLVMAGGKLGRHPQLARVIKEMATPEEAAQLAIRAAELYLNEGKPEERFGSILNRLGWDIISAEGQGLPEPSASTAEEKLSP